MGQDFTASLDLREDETGELVKVAGPTGALEPMRVQQLMRVEPVGSPQGFHLPPSVPSRSNMLLAFPNGLQLFPGKSYRWNLEIDGQTRTGWSARFHVAGPPPPPVFGGPANTDGLEDMPPLGEVGSDAD